MSSSWRTFGVTCAAALVLTSCTASQTATPSESSSEVAPLAAPPNLTTAEPLATASKTEATSVASSENAAAASTTMPQTGLEKLKFKRGDGSEAFSIKFKPDGGKLVDSSDRELARFKAEANQTLRIKGADDQAIGYVIPQGEAWAITGANSKQVLFVLRPQAQGEHQLEQGDGTVVHRITAHDGGYRISDAAGQTATSPEPTYRVKVKPGKLSLRDGAGETLLSTKGDMKPLAIAAFALDPLNQEQQAALALALHTWGH